jgi:hypothetical protein
MELKILAVLRIQSSDEGMRIQSTVPPKISFCEDLTQRAAQEHRSTEHSTEHSTEGQETAEEYRQHRQQ